MVHDITHELLHIRVRQLSFSAVVSDVCDTYEINYCIVKSL